jgi:hypothetical protein
LSPHFLHFFAVLSGFLSLVNFGVKKYAQGSMRQIFEPLLQIRIRIRMFLGIPDPLVRGTDRDADPSMSSSKNSKKNLDFLCFVTSL